MRINNDGVQNLGDNGASTSVSSVASGSRRASGAIARTSADQVTLSNGSNLVALAKGAVSPERQARLNQLKQQVHSGDYHPDLSEVSHALIESVF